MEAQSLKGEPMEVYCATAERRVRYNPILMECIQPCGNGCPHDFSKSVVLRDGEMADVVCGSRSLSLSYGKRGITMSHSGTPESVSEALKMAKRYIRQ